MQETRKQRKGTIKRGKEREGNSWRWGKDMEDNGGENNKGNKGYGPEKNTQNFHDNILITHFSSLPPSLPSSQLS